MRALPAARLTARKSDGMSADELARFNALPLPAALAKLLECCSSPAWAERMASGRPYSSARDAARQSSAIVARLTVADLQEALDGQSRCDGPAADPAKAADMAGFRREYEQRFGHLYLASVAGRSGAQQLALLRARLRNRPQAEWQAVRTELQKINEIRLTAMLSGRS